MKESNKKKENEKGIQINEAINQCLSGMVSMISTIDDNMKKAKGLKTKTTGNLLATGDKSAPVQEQELTSMVCILSAFPFFFLKFASVILLSQRLK